MDYLEQLKKWALYAGATLALALATALMTRFVGVTPQVQPPPPVTIVVQPAPGTDQPPTVTVHRP